MPYLFKIEQKVKVKKPGHPRDKQIGIILYHAKYVGNEPTQEVVHFGYITKGKRPTFDSCLFEQSEIGAV